MYGLIIALMVQQAPTEHTLVIWNGLEKTTAVYHCGELDRMTIVDFTPPKRIK